MNTDFCRAHGPASVCLGPNLTDKQLICRLCLYRQFGLFNNRSHCFLFTPRVFVETENMINCECVNAYVPEALRLRSGLEVIITKMTFDVGRVPNEDG